MLLYCSQCGMPSLPRLTQQIQMDSKNIRSKYEACVRACITQGWCERANVLREREREKEERGRQREREEKRETTNKPAPLPEYCSKAALG